jgi:hypothetical protein
MYVEMGFQLNLYRQNHFGIPWREGGRDCTGKRGAGQDQGGGEEGGRGQEGQGDEVGPEQIKVDKARNPAAASATATKNEKEEEAVRRTTADKRRRGVKRSGKWETTTAAAKAMAMATVTTTAVATVTGDGNCDGNGKRRAAAVAKDHLAGDAAVDIYIPHVIINFSWVLIVNEFIYCSGRRTVSYAEL